MINAPLLKSKMEIEKIHHIAIICSNYEESKYFYTEILPFTIQAEHYRAERQSYKLDLCLNGEYILELFSFPTPPKRLSHPEACGGRHLALAVKAAGLRASLGEISDACEAEVGRYKAIIRTISGVYSSETKNDSDFQRACELAEKFAKKEGRQPRIMIAKMGQDGHDRGAKVVATGYADCGFDVDMGPLFQTPAEAAREAVENDVHVLGVSSLAAGHKTLVPQVIEELKKLGRPDILVIAGGVIPAQDYDFLYKAGVAAIYGPGTSVAKAACQILEILLGEENK